MTTLGVFRDDYYNCMAALAQNQYATTTQATGTVLAATNIAGAQEVYLLFSGQAAISVTTDTAANIIARLQNAVAVQYQASGVLQQSPGAAIGVPNLLNCSYYFDIINNNSASITMAGGAGVTMNGLIYGAAGSAVILTATTMGFLVTITGPNSVTITRIAAGTP
jgi:hypothetical protein